MYAFGHQNPGPLGRGFLQCKQCSTRSRLTTTGQTALHCRSKPPTQFHTTFPTGHFPAHGIKPFTATPGWSTHTAPPRNLESNQAETLSGMGGHHPAQDPSRCRQPTHSAACLFGWRQAQLQTITRSWEGIISTQPIPARVSRSTSYRPPITRSFTRTGIPRRKMPGRLPAYFTRSLPMTCLPPAKLSPPVTEQTTSHGKGKHWRCLWTRSPRFQVALWAPQWSLVNSGAAGRVPFGILGRLQGLNPLTSILAEA